MAWPQSSHVCAGRGKAKKEAVGAALPCRRHAHPHKLPTANHHSPPHPHPNLASQVFASNYTRLRGLEMEPSPALGPMEPEQVM